MKSGDTMKDNGKMEREMEKVHMFGQIKAIMLANGKENKAYEREN